MALALYVASSNSGKLRDFRTAAEHTSIEIDILPGLSDIPAPDETGTTFAENARLKARYYSSPVNSRHLPGQLVLADDSGLEVPALCNAPGVRSARFADDAHYLLDSSLTTDERNNLYLLDRMCRLTNRSARYRCVLALARDGADVLAVEGEVTGEILAAPRGTGGFGYDPLFYIPELGKTMAEIDLDTKHHLSHRGNALRALFAHMQQITLIFTP